MKTLDSIILKSLSPKAFKVFALMVSGILLSPSSIAAASDEPNETLKVCLDQLQAKVERRFTMFERIYTIYADYPVRMKRKYTDQLLIGDLSKNNAVLLMHGFTASPHEMRHLAQSLNDQGYTVYTPLITGFGFHADVANKVPYSEWVRAIGSGMRSLAECYKNIHVVGFSLGGGLSVDFLLNTYQEKKNYFKVLDSVHIQSLTLLSPYIKTSVPMGGVLNKSADAFTDKFSLVDAYIVSGNPDLEEGALNPEDYDEYIPIKATGEMLKFAFHLRTFTPRKKRSQVPTFLAYTEYDHTIDWKEARDFTLKHFTHVEVRAYPANEQVRHQLHNPRAGHDAKALFKGITDFIKRNDAPLTTTP